MLGKQIKLVDRLTIDQRQHLLACILSDKCLFGTARIRLKVEYFTNVDEVYLRVVWVVVQSLVEKLGVNFLFENDRAKLWNILDTECKAYFRNNSSSCPLDQWEPLFGIDPPGFLAWLFNICNPNEFTKEYGTKLFSQFMQERAVNDLWQKLSSDSSHGVLTTINPYIEKIKAAQEDLLAIDFDPVLSAAPEGWLPPAIKRRPTGIVWLDKFLRGGHAAPETYGLLGAYGSGKTTFALQLATNVAFNEQLFAADPVARSLVGIDAQDYKMGSVYYFHYEMPVADIRKKLWSGAAYIDYDRIEKLGTKGFSLSSGNNLSTAEKAMYNVVCEQNNLKLSDIPGEAERLDRALKMLRVNLFTVDCTGNGSAPSVGTGYVQEISDILSREVAKGRRIACVVIDYAGACVDRHTTDKDMYYQLLSQFGRRCEHEVGVPFDTPVWIMHQLAGAENNRTVATKQHHANAAGSKRFGENLWFCFNIGTSDEKTGCRYFTCSKARRSELGSSPVLKIAGGYNRLIDVSNVYRVDSKSNVKERHASAQVNKPINKQPGVMSGSNSSLDKDLTQ